jgi:anti-sigma regulatory factor (Ser/Thr protein kinase)
VPVPGGREMAWSHEIELAADPASPGRARHFVALHLVEHGLRYLVEDVRLVVSEFATNAVLHARTPFTVGLGSTDRSVLVAVRDGAVAVPVAVVAELLAVGGRGLHIVDRLSTAWGVVAGDASKSVWASFDLRQ